MFQVFNLFLYNFRTMLKNKFKWKKLNKPFTVLAPMEDVTDIVFRQVVSRASRPDVFFTEFTNVEGLQSKEGYKKVSERLKYEPKERPIIAQIWGITPENYYNSTKEIIKRGFDGVDINMGCPIKSVVKKGACSALINNHKLAERIIKAVKDASKGKIEVSVKTRIGFKTDQSGEWFNFLLKQDIDALTIHARTVKDLSKVPAKWVKIEKAVEIRDSLNKKTVIIGNGDIDETKKIFEYSKKYGCEGIMIGRGVFKNLFIFDKNIDFDDLGALEKLDFLEYHLSLYLKYKGEKAPIYPLRKFFKIYLRGFKEANKIRQNLMEAKTYNELQEKIKKLKRQYA